MGGARKALIIATYEYADQEISQLRAPEHDADALREVLSDPTIGDFEVKALVNKPWHELQIGIGQFLREGRTDDLLLLHFSCHGLKNDDGQLYFAGTDTLLDALEDTAVRASHVNEAMNRSRAGTILLLLDCCYSGAFADSANVRAGDRSIDIGDRLGGNGRAVITASTAWEYAFENGRRVDEPTDERLPSVFTGAVVQGLRSGAADLNGDGVITLDEFYLYVRAEVTRSRPNQNPTRRVNVQGDPQIAFSPVDLDCLPPEVRSRAGSGDYADRQRAIEHLRTFLGGSDLYQQRAARSLLREMAVRDSTPEIREAAQIALTNPLRVDGGPTVPGDYRPQDISDAPMAIPEQTIAIYRWLRIGVVCITLLLLVAVLMEAQSSGWCLQPSISAYYHTSAQPVFVAAFILLGAILVILRGSSEWENVILKLSGAMAVVVGLVPTAQVNRCGVSLGTATLADEVATSVRAVLIVALAASVLILAFLLAGSGSHRSPVTVASTVIWLALVLAAYILFQAEREAFLNNAHYIASITMFTLFVALALIHFREAAEGALGRNHFIYAAIAVTMALLPIVASLATLLTEWDQSVLLLEATEFLLIGLFFVVQAIELWNSGLRNPG